MTALKKKCDPMVITCRKEYLLGILAPFFWEGGQDVVL